MSWHDVIKKPFGWADVDVKVQSTNKDKTKALVVCYLDSRATRRRFDEAFGPENWTSEYKPVHGEGGKLIAAQCRVTVTLPDGKTVVREEIGAATAIEPVKGAYSDAIKRCLVAFGHDSLYEVSLGWHPITDNKFAPFTPQTLASIRRIYEDAVKDMSSRESPTVQVPDDEPPPAATGNGAARVAERLGVEVWSVFGNGADRFLQRIGMSKTEAEDWMSQGVGYSDVAKAKTMNMNLEGIRKAFEDVARGVTS